MERAEAALTKARADLEGLPDEAAQSLSQNAEDVEAIKAEIRALSEQVRTHSYSSHISRAADICLLEVLQH